jgi:hypothetical protein
MEVKWLTTYTADKYAGMLTEEDVANLFNLLVAKLDNNRSEAARRCGLTGKATYDWEEAAYVKLGTKKKVVNTALTETFLETIEYLLGRSTDRSLDLLRTILSTLYANAIEAGSQNDFEVALTRFEMIQRRYQGMIRDGIHDEVTDMLSLLRKRALDFGLPLRTKSLNELSAEELVDAIQIVGHLYIENPTEAELFAERDLGLTTQALKPVIQTFRDLCIARRVQTTAIAGTPEETQRTAAAGAALLWTVAFERSSPTQPAVAIPQLGKLAEKGPIYEITQAN